MTFSHRKPSTYLGSISMSMILYITNSAFSLLPTCSSIYSSEKPTSLWVLIANFMEDWDRGINRTKRSLKLKYTWSMRNCICFFGANLSTVYLLSEKVSVLGSYLPSSQVSFLPASSSSSSSSSPSSFSLSTSDSTLC